ncbi:MAG: hypothetical protein ACYC7A_13350 [Thermoanaerobaculia bacterium]
MARRRGLFDRNQAVPEPHLFAAAIRDETWHVGSAPRLVESRAEAGYAKTSVRNGAFEIEATDDFTGLDAPADTADSLRDRAGAAISRARGVIEARRERDAVARLVARSRWIRIGERIVADELVTATLSLPYGAEEAAIAASPSEIAKHWKWLVAAVADIPRRACAWERTPLLWKNGTGAVLLHEAAGHPAERHAAPVEWPAWLRALDGTGGGYDDCGLEIAERDLLRGVPSALRRATFRDVPTLRMSELSVVAADAPFVEADESIEILLVDHGTFDPLADRVALRVVIADFVRGGNRERLEPFTYRASRAAVAASLAGAQGEAVAFPGVICSDEGQRLPVASKSPDLLTRPLEAE